MTMLRLGVICLLLFGGAAAEARRGLNDSGACVEACSLGAGEPCPPCPPRLTGRNIRLDEIASYRAEVSQYEGEMQAFAARNPQKMRTINRAEAIRTRALNLDSLVAAMTAMRASPE